MVMQDSQILLVRMKISTTFQEGKLTVCIKGLKTNIPFDPIITFLEMDSEEIINDTKDSSTKMVIVK